MSKYKVHSKIDGCLDAYVGWDNPTESFFCQVFDSTTLGEDDQLFYSIGADPRKQYTDLSEFLKEIQDKVELNEYIINKLKYDYENRTEPTPLQKKMRNLFKGD